MKRSSFLVVCFLLITCLNGPMYADEASHRASAEELLQAMRSEEILAKQMDSMKKVVGNFFPPPADSKEPVTEVVARQSKIMDFISKNLSWDVLKPDFVQAYMEVFTESEMKELTAFYKSPIGQKLLEKTPELTAKTMQITQKRAMALMPEIQKMISDLSGGAKKDSAKPDKE